MKTFIGFYILLVAFLATSLFQDKALQESMERGKFGV